MKWIAGFLVGLSTGLGMALASEPTLPVCGAEDEVIVFDWEGGVGPVNHRCRNFDDLIEEDGRYFTMWQLADACEARVSSTVVSAP